jgi:hypothetical protein
VQKDALAVWRQLPPNVKTFGTARLISKSSFSLDRAHIFGERKHGEQRGTIIFERKYLKKFDIGFFLIHVTT